MSEIISEYKPSSLLTPYVEFFWAGKFNVYSAGKLSQRVIPYGYVELIIHLSDEHCELLDGSDFASSPEFLLIGLFTKPYEIQFKRVVDVFGIRFKPEGIYHLLGIPASEVHHCFADMESLVGKNFREFFSKLKELNSTPKMISLTEKFLLYNIGRSKSDLYYLNRAAEIIRIRKGRISIDELAELVYISKRQLEREFKQKLGITPKRYMRIARLNEINRKIKNGDRIDLTGLSYSAGYSDQAHLIRDFKEFTGESPRVLLNNREKFIINPDQADL